MTTGLIGARPGRCSPARWPIFGTPGPRPASCRTRRSLGHACAGLGLVYRGLRHTDTERINRRHTTEDNPGRLVEDRYLVLRQLIDHIDLAALDCAGFGEGVGQHDPLDSVEFDDLAAGEPVRRFEARDIIAVFFIDHPSPLGSIRIEQTGMDP